MTQNQLDAKKLVATAVTTIRNAWAHQPGGWTALFAGVRLRLGLLSTKMITGEPLQSSFAAASSSSVSGGNADANRPGLSVILHTQGILAVAILQLV